LLYIPKVPGSNLGLETIVTPSWQLSG